MLKDQPLNQHKKYDLDNLAALQETLGVTFNNQLQLKQALIHSSYVNENPDLAPISNERLEFLGDAVLGLVITEKLYQELPDATEGEMTKLRAALVSRETLTRLARAARLGDYLYLGKGEEASGGRHKPTTLASTLEAIVAAVFLDQGLAITKDFILRLLKGEMEKVIRHGGRLDYKSRLQEVIQAREQSKPRYYIVEESGPQHCRQFTVEVRVGDTVIGRGSGKSKKSAETEAARAALENI